MVNNQAVPVSIHYETRSSSRVSITKKGVNIRISRFLSSEDKRLQIQQFKDWAFKKLNQRPELMRPPRKDYYSGKVISVRNKSFVLNLQFTDARTNIARVENSSISIILSSLLSESQMEKTIGQLVSKCIAKSIHTWVHERLTTLNEQHFPDKKFRTLRLKYTNSLWGSCSPRGDICISTRLLLAPDFVMDYVLIHELAHLVVPNHSRKFWQVVSHALPDFEASERWLKENGKHCDF